MMDLEQCLNLLKNAKTDNEKMAALLLISKLVQSDRIEPEDRKKVFNAVGFSFINRLLSTKTVPEGCTENPYHKIAMTLLACFCTDQDLVLHPQITAKIPLFNEFVLQRSAPAASVDEGCSMSEDALQCLQALSGSSTGLQHLLRHGTLEVLAKTFLDQVPVSEAAKDLLLYILGHKGAQSSDTYPVSASSAMQVLVETFKTNQDELKFQLCDIISSALSLSGDLLLTLAQPRWLNEVALGLKDILMSKVDPPRRNKAIHLSAVLCQLLGVEWAVLTSTRLFTLLVHLVCVEVRIALEDKEFSEVVETAPSLCSCFVIMESSVVYIAKHSESEHSESDQTQDEYTSSLLSQEDLLQIHMALTEALSYVVRFLQSVVSLNAAASSRLKTPGHSIDPQSVFYEPLIVASVRVLGAWLAEDSLALSSDVYHLIPSLIKIYSNCRDSTEPYNEESDILKFLLPGLCHLTADDKARAVLVKENFQQFFLSYMQTLLPLCNSSSELSGRLSLCCGVLHNVCVCDPETVKKDDSFTAIALCCLKIITSDGSDSTLALNAVLLFLMISRRQDSNSTPTSYVLAESYREQQTSGCRNLQNLQCWANKYDMLVVEPFVEDSLLGAPLDTLNATTLKFSDMFDIDSWNTESSEKGNSKLVPWDTFLQQAPRNLIVVVIAYHTAGESGPQMTDTSRPRYLQGCPDTNHWPNEHQMNVLATHKFNVVRRVCFNFQYKDHLTLDNFHNAIFGDYGHENVTVFFREWRSATVNLGAQRILVKEGGCSRNWLEESMPASRRVIKEAELYARTYLSSPNGNGGYIAIMARLEKAKKLFGVKRIPGCLRKILDYHTKVARENSLSKTFLAIDVGKYGSHSFSTEESHNLEEEFHKFFKEMYKGELSIPEWERTFENVSRTSDSGYIALLQKVISTKADCLIFLGGGSFQRHAMKLYQSSHPEKDWCIHFVQGCTKMNS